MVKMLTAVSLAAFLFGSAAAAPTSTTRPPMCLCKFVAPTYSRLARTAGWEGTVLIRVVYGPAGVPKKVDLVSPPLGPYATFRESALSVVKEWRFCPTDGHDHEITITFRFRLKDGKPTETDEWSPTEVSFEPPATINISVTASRVIAQ